MRLEDNQRGWRINKIQGIQVHLALFKILYVSNPTSYEEFYMEYFKFFEISN